MPELRLQHEGGRQRPSNPSAAPVRPAAAAGREVHLRGGADHGPEGRAGPARGARGSLRADAPEEPAGGRTARARCRACWTPSRRARAAARRVQAAVRRAGGRGHRRARRSPWRGPSPRRALCPRCRSCTTCPRSTAPRACPTPRSPGRRHRRRQDARWARLPQATSARSSRARHRALRADGPRRHPEPGRAQVRRASTFLLSLPNTAAPADGYPVTIFGHGLRSHQAPLPIFNPGHGRPRHHRHGHRVPRRPQHLRGYHRGRWPQRGNAAIDTPDKAATRPACDVDADQPHLRPVHAPVAVACDPRGPAEDCAASWPRSLRGRPALPTRRWAPARVASGPAPTDGTPSISGWNMLDLTNLFATRDNFRQHTIDHAQLARILSAAASTPSSRRSSQARSTAPRSTTWARASAASWGPSTPPCRRT